MHKKSDEAFVSSLFLCDAVLANACFLELELKTDLEVAAGSGVPVVIVCWISIRAVGSADIGVELVKDVVHSGKEGGFFGELVVGSQIPYPVVGIVAHFGVGFVAVAVHDAATVEGSIELVSGITNSDIKCAFRKFSVTVDVFSRLSLHMEIGVTNAGIPMMAEIFVQIEREAIDIGFAGVFISIAILDEIFGMGVENIECSGQSIAEIVINTEFNSIAFLRF